MNITHPNLLRPALILGIAISILFGLTGLAQSQDFDAVKRRLFKAVKHNELTLEQAAVMMEALKHAARDHEERMHDEEMHRREMHEERMDRDRDREHEHERQEMAKRKHFEKMIEKIERAAESGKLSPKVASQKIEAIANELFGDKNEDEWEEGDERKAHFERIAKAIENAVEEGKMSEDDAERKLMALKKELWGDGKNKKEKSNNGENQNEKERVAKQDLDRIINRIKAAVETGRLTEEQANWRIEEIKEAHAQKNFERENSWVEQGSKKKAEMRKSYERFENAIRRAVESGEMTREEGREKAMAMRRKLEGQAAKEDQAEFMRVVRRIEMAVESGRISKEDAKARIRQMKETMAEHANKVHEHHDDNSHDDYDGDDHDDHGDDHNGDHGGDDHGDDHGEHGDDRSEHGDKDHGEHTDKDNDKEDNNDRRRGRRSRSDRG